MTHGSYCSYFSYSNFRHRMALHQIEDNIIENHMSLIYIYIFISSLQSIQHGEITCSTDKNYMTFTLLSTITYDCHWLNASSSTQLLFNIKHTEPYRTPCGTSLPFFVSAFVYRLKNKNKKHLLQSTLFKPEEIPVL